MKTSTPLSLAAATCAALAFSNCTSSKLNDVEVSNTGIVLREANYRVVATQVKGEDKGFHILSAIPTSIPGSLSDIGDFFSLSADGGLALNSATRAKAMENLYKNCGDLRNRATALINLREEKGGTNLLLFSRPKYTITADLIEFIK